MRKRKPGKIALDAIDASLVEAQERAKYFDTESWPAPHRKWKQAIAELRAWRGVVVACGKASKETLLNYSSIEDYDGAICAICRAILKARDVEARRVK